MEDKEERRVLDQTKHGQDLEELNREWYVDAPVNQLHTEQMEVFRIVTETMNKILEEKNPSLVIDQRLDTTTRYALEALFEARMSRNVDTNTFISGLIRDKQLNQALMHLQPILAIALRPDFREGRIVYERLVEDLNHLRSDITSSILVEMPFQEAPAEDKAEEQDDDDDDASDDAGGDAGDGTLDATDDDAVPSGEGERDRAGDGDGDGNKANEPREGWFGRLLGRRGKNKARDANARNGKEPARSQDSGPEEEEP